MMNKPKSPDHKSKNDIHIYTRMNIDRKIEKEEIEIPRVGGENSTKLLKEMVTRGLYRTEPGEISSSGKPIGTRYIGDLSPVIQKCDEHIIEGQDKQYKINTLSLLNLIETVLIELTKKAYPIDTLKIEILLVLFEKDSMFRNKETLMSDFHKAPSLDNATYFFLVLQSYLYSVGKMLVVEKKHDVLINKPLDGKITLTPTEEFDPKYEYFSMMSGIYL
jgi:hypothetical protein